MTGGVKSAEPTVVAGDICTCFIVISLELRPLAGVVVPGEFVGTDSCSVLTASSNSRSPEIVEGIKAASLGLTARSAVYKLMSS